MEGSEISKLHRLRRSKFARMVLSRDISDRLKFELFKLKKKKDQDKKIGFKPL